MTTPPVTAIDTPSAVTLLARPPSLQGRPSPVATNDVVLVRTSSTPGSGTTAAGRAESIAFDAQSGRAFVTNAAQGAIDIVQVRADGTAQLVQTISLKGLPAFGAVNSVAVANGVVAVAYQNASATGNGQVALFSTAGILLQTIEVGNLPDQLTFTPDGQRLLVANEGETISAQSNPTGSVSIISLAGGAGQARVTQTIGFESLNALDAQLTAAGTPRSLVGFTRAQEAEPEYIAVSADGTRAYVTVQELNLVAVIDLTNPDAREPLAILPLGAVDHSLPGNAADFSDRDGIDIANFDVEGLLMPDAIATFTVGGTTYFVTANEGDSRDFPGVVDEVRVGAASYVLDPTAYPDAAALKNNNALGRLTVLTTAGDTDGDGDIDQITAFGGRGISIFRQNADGSITKVRETGGEFEAIIARDRPAVFNGENDAAFDSRSDNKAGEPEGVTVGQVGDRIYAFVSLERAGGVMTYDVTDPANAFFVGYRPPSASDYAPEVITFVSAANSPTGTALVLTANEVSGTTTVYTVQRQTAGDDVLRGGLDADRFDGGAGNDTLIGGLGADVLNGGTGIDTVSYADNLGGVFVNLLTGRGAGNAAQGDTYSGIENVMGSLFADSLVGDAGGNRLDGAGGDDELIGGLGADVLIGGDGIDTVSYIDNYGSVFVNLDIGRGFNNAAEGDTYQGIENVTGGGFADFLIGSDGANRLAGGAGADTLIGAGGADRFAFDRTALVGAGVDRIVDFARGEDRIELDATAFGLPAGQLAAAAFGTGSATTAAQRILYDAATGALSYDADGNGSGAAIVFAILENRPATLSAADFVIA